VERPGGGGPDHDHSRGSVFPLREAPQCRGKCFSAVGRYSPFRPAGRLTRARPAFAFPGAGARELRVRKSPGSLPPTPGGVPTTGGKVRIGQSPCRRSAAGPAPPSALGRLRPRNNGLRTLSGGEAAGRRRHARPAERIPPFPGRRQSGAFRRAFCSWPLPCPARR